MTDSHLDNEYLLELKNYKLNLEWLLTIFEGSMDNRVF